MEEDVGRFLERNMGRKRRFSNSIHAEKPKKSCKFSDSKNRVLPSSQPNLCKFCGKRFRSMRALCGHMRCHSNKYRASNGSSIRLEQKLGFLLDGQSNGQTAVPIRRKRSRRAGCRVPATPFIDFNYSSSISEIGEEEEEEEGAMSLLMLSCGMGNESRFKSLTDSFDYTNGYGFDDTPCPMVFPMGVGNWGRFLKKEYDSTEPKMSELEDGTKKEFGNGRMETLLAALDKDMMTGREVHPTNLESVETSSRKKAKLDDTCHPELRGNCCSKTKYVASDSEMVDNPQEGGNYTWWTFHKGLRSQRPFMSRRKSHKTVKTCPASDTRSCRKSNENSIEHRVGGMTVGGYYMEKSEGHQCSICFKVFRSGQALGGHKRTHFLGNSETTVQQMVRNQEVSKVDEVFNLKKEANDHVVFKHCWAGSNLELKPLMVLISS
ncbi:uncharacterized protein LOC131147171 [Malania oleifera]|uniref:uncharacterized protein LOC131147171 n=1 Tax=Malania oleifera TaxID=397392 RepID=UPI0025ADFCA0|nr:uncharacterized protein LOC131147171 [Malania oleifera]